MDNTALDVRRAPAATPAPAAATDPNGSEILVRCLQAENVQYLWGYPGGAVLYIYDALYKQQSIQHVLVRHEQAAIHAADGYARATGEVGVALVTSGPGRHERSDRHRHGLHGFDPDGHRHRPGADAGDRPRCLPGVRHRRHHAADRQAQLPGQGRQGPGSDIEEGVPHRPHRPPRPGGGRRAKRRLDGNGTLFLPADRGDALLQPGEEGPWRANQESGAAPARCPAALHLHRRRRRPRKRLGRAARSWSTCSASPAPTR